MHIARNLFDPRRAPFQISVDVAVNVFDDVSACWPEISTSPSRPPTLISPRREMIVKPALRGIENEIGDDRMIAGAFHLGIERDLSADGSQSRFGLAVIFAASSRLSAPTRFLTTTVILLSSEV